MRPRPQGIGKLDRMRTAAVIAALLALGIPQASQAETAKTAAPKPPTKTAKPAAENHHALLTAAAAKGDAEAQYELAQAYLHGHGVKPNAALALSWLEMAATNGHLRATLEVAKAYQDGRGVKANPAMAGRWLYHAAALGDAAAREQWISLLLAGKITAITGPKAVAWLAERANSGDLKAAMILGEAFETGAGIAPDADQAEEWYRFAAQRFGNAEAEYRLGRILLGLPAAWRIPSEEEWAAKESDRNKDKPFGAVWYPVKPTGYDDKIVQLRPGIVEGARHLEAAARRGHAEAQYTLGMAMLGGMELPMDQTGAVSWLEAAAAQGHAEAMMALADCSAKGQGFFAKDPVRAYVMYDLAAASGEDGAGSAREAIAKTLSPRQMGRARQLVQEIRESLGL